MMEKKQVVEQGSTAAPSTFYIKVTPQGPYLVYGKPPIDEEIIVPNAQGKSWEYRSGKQFDVAESPVALCRCGGTENAPFCDGSHLRCAWDGTETNDHRPLLEEADELEGPDFILADNERYCAFARFCDAEGGVWNLAGMADNAETDELVRHEVGHCPSGRLVLYEKRTGKVYEPPFAPSVSVIEDPGIQVSGPIWVKGGIRIEGADGRSYEVRNRVTLCRCGASGNKPFCDGTHAAVHFKEHRRKRGNEEK